MIRVRWRDGHVTEAGSWAWVLRRLQADPWNAPWAHDARGMRNELSRRAYVHSGEIVNPALPAPAFWFALAATGLVDVTAPACTEGIHTGAQV